MQPISGKLNTPVRKFVVKERVLFMHDGADTIDRDAIEKSTPKRSILIMGSFSIVSVKMITKI